MCVSGETGTRSLETFPSKDLEDVFKMFAAALVPLLGTEYVRVAELVPYLHKLRLLVLPTFNQFL
jgi:hypothetical protein